MGETPTPTGLPTYHWLMSLQPLEHYFARNGWQAFDFQRQTWSAYLAGRSGLVHAPTGSGKTFAVFGGPVLQRIAEGPTTIKSKKRDTTEPARLIWITPMRALATDTTHALTCVVKGLGLNWSVELRTSDTGAAARKKQRERMPTVLVTTPESLSVLISYVDAREKLTGLECAVVDEWHELLSTKRGVQIELGLARLRAFNPAMRTWGLSATLANLAQARDVLLGTDDGVMIHADIGKRIAVDSLIPGSIEKFPWGGHMGLRMLMPVIEAIDASPSTLVFTNTRAQSEIWFRAITEKRPDWIGQIAVHHGSLDRNLRQKVEAYLREGQLKAVVCTSSLDLGVDFPAVEQVIQIGSPKGIGRLMQRAGRSGHRPGKVSRVLCAPTHAFELIEFSAAREGIETKSVEPRKPLDRPLDVLAQHVVTVASGGGFDQDELKAEVRTTHAFRKLSDEEWGWTMDFVIRGGPTLTAYPRFQRVKQAEDGRWIVATDQQARLHRLGIGTITGDGVLQIVITGGKKLGTLEESYLSRLNPGDNFIFAGRPLKLIGIRQMVARVRTTTRFQGSVPSWPGGKFPLSTQLSDGVRRRLEEAKGGVYRDEEMRRLAPLLQLQGRWSCIPATDELVIEHVASREGVHHFVYPFLGRLVHEGLGALLAYRIKRTYKQPVTAAFTDYGIELVCPEDPLLDETGWRHLLSPDNVIEDLLACLNAGELTKRQFREIARIAGLILATSPGAPRTVRQLQATSELFYDVFREFDPENLLLKQAQREVLEQQLEFNRLTEALRKLQTQTVVSTFPRRVTPMGFPIWAQRISSQTIRVEEASARIERMVAALEKAMDAGEPVSPE